MLSLSLHFPPELNHFLHTFFVPFSVQLLDKELLRDRDARETGGIPVELPDLEELLENVRPLLLGNLLLENFLADWNLRGDEPLPAGVTLYGLPPGLEDRPLPFPLGLCRGLCRGVPARDEILLEWADRPLEVVENTVLPPEDLDPEKFRE